MEFPPEVCVHEQAASRRQRAISTLLQPFSFHTSRTHASLHCPSLQVFGNVTEDAKTLIKKLTMTDPAERFSCEDALAHTWLADGAPAAADTDLGEAVLHNRRKSTMRRASKDVGSDGDLEKMADQAAAEVAAEEAVKKALSLAPVAAPSTAPATSEAK